MGQRPGRQGHSRREAVSQSHGAPAGCFGAGGASQAAAGVIDSRPAFGGAVAGSQFINKEGSE